MAMLNFSQYANVKNTRILIMTAYSDVT